MVIALLALVGICWAFVYKRTRPFALLGLAALVGYIIYDNFISEAPLTGEYYEVKDSKVTELSPVTFKLVMKIKNLHKTADLESVNVNVDLQDCDKADNCSVYAKQEQQIQVLAKPQQVKTVEKMYYFDNLPKMTGKTKAVAEVTTATGDW
jgi:uncharacterized protein (TIGR02588 family)